MEKDYMNPWNWDKEVRKDLTPGTLIVGAFAATLYLLLWIFQ